MIVALKVCTSASDVPSMTDFEHMPTDDAAERATRVISHLDGALDATMLDAMQGVWSTLERASVSGEAHARAVRARLFWQSLSPAEGVVPASSAAASDDVAVDIVPSWMLQDDSEDDRLPDLADAA